MGRNELKIDAQKAEFTSKFILRVFLAGYGEKGKPLRRRIQTWFDRISCPHFFFREISLKLSLWPLLVDFFSFTRLTLSQLNPNVIRIMGGIVALNRAHGTYLRLDDLKYCYSLT